MVDPNMASARLLTDLLKELGARQRLQAVSTARALEVAADWQPQLIFMELAGPALDGVDFTRRLRRSTVACRKAPVIIVSADTREASIKAARDAGAHEFLCKPFTAGHVFRRVENVTLKPRPWIDAKMYVGPDRRRFNSGDYEGQRKRDADNALLAAAAAAYTAADTAIRGQLDLMDTDPQAALHNIMAETVALQSAATGPAENPLTRAIYALQTYLLAAMSGGHARRDAVEQHLAVIRTAREQMTGKAALRPPVPASMPAAPSASGLDAFII